MNQYDLNLNDELKEFIVESLSNPYHSYVVLKKFFDPNLLPINKLIDCVKRNGYFIFQTRDCAMNDNKRMQFTLKQGYVNKVKGLKELFGKVCINYITTLIINFILLF